MGALIIGGGMRFASIFQTGDFAPLGGCLQSGDSTIGSTYYGSETPFAAITSRIAGTISFFAGSITDQGTGRTVTLRKNGANANAGLSFPDSTLATTYDTTHTDHLNGTSDTFDFTVAGSLNNAYWWLTGVFTADSGHGGFYASSLEATSDGTRYYSVFGTGSGHDATETNTSVRMRAPGTWKNLLINCFSASTAQLTIVSRITGVTGNQTITISANATGQFEDTTHSDTYASGDLLCVQVAGATGGLTAIQPCSWLSYSNTSKSDVFASGQATVQAFSSADLFAAPTADSGQKSNVFNGFSESVSQFKHNFSVTMSNFRLFLYPGGNTMTGTTTFKTRVNGADGNQVLTVPTTQTGWFEDAVNTDSVGSTDLVNYVCRGGTSGNIAIGAIVITETLPTAIGAQNLIFM